MNIEGSSRVGNIATEHPLATRVFHRHNIDFCCGGGKPLAEACEARGVDVDKVLGEITAELDGASGADTRWDQEPFDALIAHILEAYHKPLNEELPRIESMARKVNEVHVDKAPDVLPELLNTVLGLKEELEQHMMKEEQILFPMILQGAGAQASGPISVMEMEHESAGGALEKLRDLTNGYTAPDGACNTWRALWAALGALEESLHEHIHLENNILFPRALAG